MIFIKFYISYFLPIDILLDSVITNDFKQYSAWFQFFETSFFAGKKVSMSSPIAHDANGLQSSEARETSILLTVFNQVILM